MFFRAQFVLLFCIWHFTEATLSGPYLLWGQDKLQELKAPALYEPSEQKLTSLFQESKAVIIFLRNSSNYLESKKYPKFQHLVKDVKWAYLPQHTLAAEPFNYNANVEVIPLSGLPEHEDEELVGGYNEAVAIYGEGEVLAMMANREDEAHVLYKREANEEELKPSTTAQAPTDETDESFIYLAEGKAILYVNSAPVLNISNKNSLKLLVHNKAVTFDDQRSKGYGRLSIIFNVDDEKVFVRFNFTLVYGTWSMKAVDIEYKEYKNILTAEGNAYDIPYAPVGFSYRCSARSLIFRNGDDTLEIKDYQVQPWLNGATKFGDVYDCVGFITAPILSGIVVSFFLIGILTLGLYAILEIKTPSRFENSRSKPLTLTTQD